MTIPLRETIACVPMWANAQDIKVIPLKGGITNRNFRVDVGGKSFHLRMPGENTELLGIDREYEYKAALIAGELEIAPEVVHFIRPEGYLVTRFVDGRHIPPEELRQPKNIQRVAELMHKIHSMPSIPGTFSAFQVVRDYTDVARQYNVEFPEKFDWLIQQMNNAEAALMTRHIIERPCHNDLLNANFLATDRQIFLLDWEYAGLGDVFFDLANFSNNHELSAEEDHLLLDCYFGNVTPRNLAHLNIMKIMSDFREAMWGQVQIGISDLDFDFGEYANKHFDRLKHNIQHPHWERWLEEVRR